jgi:hypothetical protein
MRAHLLILPLLACAAPALAQPAPPPPPPPQLLDPATADRLADGMQALSEALLDIRVGELQAAIEGREATAAEKKLTVRDLGRRDDRDFDRHLREQIAATKPVIAQSMKALNEALPGMMQGLEQARESLERATANMPDPNYPRR